MFRHCLISAIVVCGVAAAQESPAAAWKQHTEAGRALEAGGHYAGAKEQFQSALRAAAGLGTGARLFLSRIELGSVTASMGQYMEAEQWDNDAVRLGIEIYGNRGSQLAAAYTNLAALYRDQGEYGRAEEFGRKAATLTAGDPTAPANTRADVLGLLGGILSRRGKLAEAETALQQSIEIAQGLPPSEILTGDWNNLADVYARTDRKAEALGLYQQAYALKQKLSGSKDPNLFYILAGMAAVQADSGHYAEAVGNIQSGIGLAEAGGAANTMQVRDALNAEAVWLHKLKRDDDAKRVRAKARQVARAATQNSYSQYTLDARQMANSLDKPKP
jgi:tetratricopeptide (TPR) repeat protein